MSEDSRWSIVELLARYDLEPQLTDVFVEGSFDKEVLTQALSQSSRRFIFYEVDVVDIAADILARYHLSSGNKQRVIALSKELGALSADARVVCLVDRDLDHWLGYLEDSPRLRWTHFSCIESHFLVSGVINDILITTGRARIKDLEIFVASLFEALKTLYALRLANQELGMSLRWVALKKYLRRTGDVIDLDLDRYIAALLGSNAMLLKKEMFLASLGTWMARLDCDIRLAVRGHDYTELLAWAMAEFDGQKDFRSQGAIERLFVLLARSVASFSQELQEYPPGRRRSAQEVLS